jgi:hypothetical protein
MPDKTIEDEIVEQIRREVRVALRTRQLVEIIIDPWHKVHGLGAYVNIIRDPRVRSYTFDEPTKPRNKR